MKLKVPGLNVMCKGSKSLVSNFADQPLVFCPITHARFVLLAFDPLFTSSAYLSASQSRKSNLSLHVS
jgi:hypothetical protein